MENDLISRSALLEQECFMDDDNGFRCSVVLSADVRNAPAVDAETLFQQLGPVKEAFDMAKADLVTVVRCGECIHRHDPKRFSCQGRHKDWFCADGVRRIRCE